MKVTKVDLSALNLPSGTHRITVKSRAVGFNDSALSNSIKYTVEGGTTETQTLIIVNQNNASEIFEFVMPMDYTFNQFVGSVYDTSGGKFTLGTSQNMPDGMRPVYFNGYLLPLDQHDQTVASGTFYYDGEAPETPETPEPPETTYEIVGTWLFDETLTEPNASFEENIIFRFFDSPTQYIRIAYRDGNDINTDYRYTLVTSREDTIRDIILYSFEGNAYYGQLEFGWQNTHYRTITFDETQTVSKDFYDWFTTNADRQTITFTIDGIEYRALSGMNWEEWVNNIEYNTDGYKIMDTAGWVDRVSIGDDYAVSRDGKYYEYKLDLIMNGNAYVTVKASHSGGSHD